MNCKQKLRYILLGAGIMAAGITLSMVNGVHDEQVELGKQETMPRLREGKVTV